MKAFNLRNVLLTLYTGLILGFVFTPIVSNVVFSFNVDRFPTIPLGGFSLTWYEQIFSDTDIRRGLVNSLAVSFFTALIATLLGFSAAYIDYRYQFIGKVAFVALVTLPPTVPVVILGLAMLTFQSQVGLTGTISGIITAHVVFCTPFALALIRMRLASLDPDIEPAAWNLGASQGSTMRSIILPYCAPAIFASLSLTAAVSFDEFMIAWFISGNNETLPVMVLSMLQGQVSPRINAVGSVVFAFTISMIVLSQLLTIRRQIAGGKTD